MSARSGKRKRVVAAAEASWRDALKRHLATDEQRHILSRVQWMERHFMRTWGNKQMPNDLHAQDVVCVNGHGSIRSPMLSRAESDLVDGQSCTEFVFGDCSTAFFRRGSTVAESWILASVETDDTITLGARTRELGVQSRRLLECVDGLWTSLQADDDDASVIEYCREAAECFFATFCVMFPKIDTAETNRMGSLKVTCEAWRGLVAAMPIQAQWEACLSMQRTCDALFNDHVRGPRRWRTRMCLATRIELTFGLIKESRERLVRQRTYRCSMYMLKSLKWTRESFCKMPELAHHFEPFRLDSDLDYMVSDLLNIDDAVRYAIATGARSENVLRLLRRRAIQRWGTEKIFRWMSLRQANALMTTQELVHFYTRCITLSLEGGMVVYSLCPRPIPVHDPVFSCEWIESQKKLHSYMTWDQVLDFGMATYFCTDLNGTDPPFDIYSPKFGIIQASLFSVHLAPYMLKQRLTEEHAEWAVDVLLNKKMYTQKGIHFGDVIRWTTERLDKFRRALIEWCRAPGQPQGMYVFKTPEYMYYTETVPRILALFDFFGMQTSTWTHLKAHMATWPTILGQPLTQTQFASLGEQGVLTWCAVSSFVTDEQRQSVLESTLSHVQRSIENQMAEMRIVQRETVASMGEVMRSLWRDYESRRDTVRRLLEDGMNV